MTSLPFPRFALRLASGIDRAANALGTFSGGPLRLRSRAERLDPEERMRGLARIREMYGAPELLDDPDLFFGTPARIDPAEHPVRSIIRGARVVDLEWAVDLTPFHPSTAEKIARYPENHRCWARWFHDPACLRPTVIWLHGYRRGDFATEQWVAPVRWLFRHGCDVVLGLLPHHGRRRTEGKVRFPGADPRHTIEGFRQAVKELRALVAFLERRGAPAVGAWGMSLGGYTAALLATVEPRLAFAVPVIPLASFADFASAGGRLVGTPEQAAAQYEALERVYRVVGPLARPPLPPPERLMVIAGEADQITGLPQARRIAEHFNCRIVTFPGGHLLQAGRRAAFREALAVVG
jgi:pimeloyl-ACP methyl ester carboxylesterase